MFFSFLYDVFVLFYHRLVLFYFLSLVNTFLRFENTDKKGSVFFCKGLSLYGSCCKCDTGFVFTILTTSSRCCESGFISDVLRGGD